MLPVGAALEAVLAWTPVLGVERVPLEQASGRVAAEAVSSARAVPAAANSAMDGFAVLGADVAEAGARLRLVDAVPAGTLRAETLRPGTAVKIFTGSVVPPGADTVVRVEDTASDGAIVTVTAAIPLGANVRQRGEDVAPGAVVVHPGDALGPADVGVLASVGRTMVTVHRRPQVAILSTGAELVEIDVEPGPAQVVNSNAPALAAAVVQAGALPRVLPLVADRFEAIRDGLAEAARSDVVLSTGGVSVGEYDFVKEALDALGVERAFWKVAQKPGKPLAFGRLGERLFFGLPGNPVSALVCFWIYAWPALRRLGGHTRLHLPVVWARLGGAVRTRATLTEFVRVHLDGEGDDVVATPAPSQSSGVLTGLGRGAGLLIVPAGHEAPAAGARVPVVVPGEHGLARSAPPPFLEPDSKAAGGDAREERP